MATRTEEKGKLRCSFCNKSQDQVRRLIAGPNVFICDECVGICQDIISEEFQDTLGDDINLMKPKEIKSFLDEYVCSGL